MKKISAFLLIIFMAIGIFYAVPTFLTAYSETEEINTKIAKNGKWSAQFENNFSENLPPQEKSQTLWGTIELFLFKEGREGVLIGQDGWLFTDEEFVADKNRNQIIRLHLNEIATVKRQLEQNNIDLVIALIPAKSRVMKEYLGDNKYPEYNESFYNQMQLFFKENNILSPNLYQILKSNEKVFLKSDTHWTPLGAKLSAQHIGQFMLQNNVQWDNNAVVQIDSNQKEKIDGDLTRYIPANNALKYKNNIAPQYARIETATVQDSANEDTNDLDSLFGDTALPITLVGTSYSADKRWNFETYLKQALQSDLLNAADEGLGPFTTMRQYLESNEFKETPPEIIIWEIPERYIPLSDKGDKAA